jgi:hypothetical protein
VAAKLLEYRAGRRARFATQGIVGSTLVFHGDIIGIPFSKKLAEPAEPAAGDPT